MSHTRDKLKLLIVEDEPAILGGLTDVFIYHGYAVDTATDGGQGLSLALSGNYDLILLDVMLPTLDGFSVCDKIREQDTEQPIIMLTARTSEEDIIAGLSLGADDYIAKPFSIRELVLRVESVLKRTAKSKAKDRVLVIAEDLHIDTLNLCTINRDPAHSPVRFTRREIEILHYLQQHAERPISREELLQQVWGYKHSSDIETRTVDIHIAKLRRKIEKDAKNPTLLVTVRGEGYRLHSANQRP